MHFDFIDQVLQQSDNPPRIIALKQVSRAEEYLQDHFAGFPVLPGVFMIETLVQAARRLVMQQTPAGQRLVLGGVRAVKYGRFVRPGEGLVVDVTLLNDEGGLFEFKGTSHVRGSDGLEIADATAVSGRFTLRPVRL